MDDEETYFWGRLPTRNYVSRRFNPANPLRMFYKTFDGTEVAGFARIKDEVVLRRTTVERREVRATVVEDDRQITTLVIQRFNRLGDPHQRERFAFVGNEIATLKRFLAGIKTVSLDSEAKSYLSDDDLAEMMLTNTQAQRLLSRRPELVHEIAASEDVSEDLIAVGYRRKQIKVFEQMIEEDTATEPEWQAFFERNRWIFGYGLSYQFLAGLEGRSLETMVRGYDVTGPGKRADGLMKTRGRICSLCFVEIKLPGTPLLQPKPYRSGAWAISGELAGAVAQVQGTAHAAMTRITERLLPRDEDGNPSGEDIFAFEPKSVLVVGDLNQFVAEHGVNVEKYRSFELYRRNTWRPEIITFDELLERARFIVEHGRLDQNTLDSSDTMSEDPF